MLTLIFHLELVNDAILSHIAKLPWSDFIMYLFHSHPPPPFFKLYQRNDIAMAITKFDQFDFLIDIVPRDDLKPPKRQVRTQEKCFYWS